MNTPTPAMVDAAAHARFGQAWDHSSEDFRTELREQIRKELAAALAVAPAPSAEDARAEAERRGRDEYWCGDPAVFVAGAEWARSAPVPVLPGPDALARVIAAWALETAGLGVSVLLCDETPGDPRGPWDYPTDAARSLATAVSQALTAKAHTTENR